MCFSAGASFTASAVLAFSGIAAIRKVIKPSQIVFACIPIIFSIQQLIEGCVWLTLTHKNMEHWQNIPIYLFVIIAQGIWPVWVPLAFWLIEKHEKRKKILKVLLITGAILSVYLTYCIIVYNIGASISPYHIHYELAFPHRYVPILGGLYFFPTIISPFVSSVRWTHLLGLLVLMSFFISKLFFNDYVISVWCFFGALVSGIIFLILNDIKIKSKITKGAYETRKYWVQLL